MANPMSEPLEPYRPERYEDSYEDYDWDYTEGRAERRPLNILWGRVAILGAIVLLAFLLGRMTAGGGGDASAAELSQARDRVEQLETENENLTGQLATVQGQLNEAQAQLQEQESQDDSGEQTASGDQGTTEPEVEIYTVRPGDTLTAIADEFYGDPSLDDFLAEFNGISDPTALSVGAKLKIPADPPE